MVRAFNEGLPLDEFIRWQVAGDLMPDPTLEQMIATGFVRIDPTTSEEATHSRRIQTKDNFDRTEAIGTVLLGMTLTCARCHSHKYDPITQTEYYQLLAFFNSTAEPPLISNALCLWADRYFRRSGLVRMGTTRARSRQLLGPVVATADGNAEIVEYARGGWLNRWTMAIVTDRRRCRRAGG
ncbi:MAG: DUF1549 domain-containing protein [Pirellulaceae bacterium]